MQKFKSIFNDKKVKQLIRHSIKGIKVMRRCDDILVEGDSIEQENKAIALVRERESFIVKGEAIHLYFDKYGGK